MAKKCNLFLELITKRKICENKLLQHINLNYLYLKNENKVKIKRTNLKERRGIKCKV